MTRIRSSVSILLVLCILMTMLPMSVFAETTEIASGTCGENVTWTLDDAGVLTVSGNGKMDNYAENTSPWYEYRELVQSAIIEGEITSIGEWTFQGCCNMTGILIPNSVTDIGWSAFTGCSKLSDVKIPDSVTDIVDYVFWGCAGLNEVAIPDSVTEISFCAFQNCSGMTSIRLGRNVNSIEEQAFSGCTNLNEVVFRGDAPTIGVDTFGDVVTTAYYPADNATWTSDIMQNYGGTITWVPYGADDNNVSDNDNTLVYLETLEITDSDRYTDNQGDSFINVLGTRNGTVDVHGNQMEHGLEAWIARWNFKNEISWAWVEYKLDAQYTNLSGKLTVISDCYNSTNFDSTIEILGDGNLLYSASLKPGMEVVQVDVDVSGVNTLRIYVYDNVAVKGGTSFGLWDFAVRVEKGVSEDGDDVTDGFPDYEITGLTIEKAFENFYVFLGDSNVYNMDEPDKGNIHTDLIVTFDSIARVDENVLSPDDIIWSSSDEHILRIISSGGTGYPVVNLRVEGLAEGTATLTAANPAGETLSFEVTVVKPNALAFTNIYDTKQYYSSGAFYSAASSISDSVEIFVQFENKQIEGYPCKVEEALIENVSVIEPITLTATILGSGLSFDRNSYQSTYSATYDAIEFNKGIYDLLMLFPYDTESFAAGSSYAVEVTLESDSFTEPLKETYSFTVYDAEKQRVDEHINFIGNNTYQISKQNIYGENMLELKDDGEYQWSKWSSFDFDNYYEVVLADLLFGMLESGKNEYPAILMALQEWRQTYSTLLDETTVIINDSFPEKLDLEISIDKIIKASKYESEAKCANDVIYQTVVDVLGSDENLSSIQNAFKAIDKTGQVFGLVEFTGNVVEDFFAWVNTINVMNAYKKADKSIQQVFETLADNIPDSEKRLKEAVEDYINYACDHSGYVKELWESLRELGADVSFDAYDKMIGVKLQDVLLSKIVNWIGSKEVTTALGEKILFSATAEFTTVQSIAGGISTGITLGLLVSDLLCDSKDKATEMGKIVAMSEYAPYIVKTLEIYEENLCTAADNNAVDLFENAFNLHKAAQSYIMEHTVSALRVKADSILQTIRGNDDYDELVANILVQKNAIDSMECCGALTNDTIVQTVKVIAIKCPVDVYVYNENGTEIVKIIDDALESAADGITVYIRDRQKYIALPANQVYTVKIIATDDGMMEYMVCEYNEQMQLHRTVRKPDIPLVTGRIFAGEVVSQLDVDEARYKLTYDCEMVGDINGDGKVNNRDAARLMQHLAGWDVEYVEAALDVNGDGKVNNRDAARLLQYLAGWDVEID